MWNKMCEIMHFRGRKKVLKVANLHDQATKETTFNKPSHPERNLWEGKVPESQNCVSCFCSDIPRSLLLAVPCGHVFCEPCISKRCSLALKDRSLIPAHCCGLEFPVEYVEKMLGNEAFTTYTRFLRERQWKGTTFRSDVEYAAVVKRIGGMQCPRCGVGIQKISGCQAVKCLCGCSFYYTYS